MKYTLGQTINVTPIRKTIATRLRNSVDTAVQANHRVRVNMSALLEARRQHKADGKSITIGDMLLKCVCDAIIEQPLINSSLTENKILIHEDINLGVAAASPWGLVVPVIKRAQDKSIEEISLQVRTLAGKARNRTLSPEEMTGGTFTVSNLGMLGVESFTAVINPPEAGILAVGAVVDTVIPENGQLIIRPLCELSLTYDHRIIDGEPAARLLMLIKKKIEAYGFTRNGQAD